MSATYGDVALDNLRAIIAKLETEMPQPPPSWAALIAALALGPAPETRVCPTCKTVGMRLARRCGHCWTALAPLEIQA
jgi:hypothetical protein